MADSEEKSTSPLLPLDIPDEQHPEKTIVVETPDEAAPYARVLYRRLQAALDAGNDMEGFNIVLQLLKENPQDETAMQLQRQLGQRVYKEAARELSAVLSDGNLNRIAQLVKRLRMMAAERQLCDLPGYRTAAAKVDEAERRYWNAMLLSGISKMKDTPDIREREAMAASVEKFAASKKLSFTPEHKALIDRVHADWAHHCHLEELRKSFREQEAFYLEIKVRVNAGTDLKLSREELTRCLDAVTELRELPEAEDLQKRINDTLQKVRSILFAQTRRKAIISSIAGIAITILVFSVALVIYAFAGAGSRADTLRNARTARNLALVQDYVEGIEPLRPLRTALSSSYEDELAASAAWLAEHKALCEQLEQIEGELKDAVSALNSPGVTPAQMTGGLVVVEKATKICKELDSRFNYQAKEAVKSLIQSYTNSMAEIRPTVLSRFTSPSSQLTLEQLDSLYKEYVNCRELLKVTYEEHEDIRRAFTAAVSAELSRMSAAAPTPDAATAIVAEFDKYNESMKLDPSLRASLADYSRRFTLFNELPQKLLTIKTLPEYIEALKVCGDCYNRVPNAVPVSTVEAMVGKEDAAMRAYKYNEFFKATDAVAAPEQMMPQLLKYKSVYANGTSLYEAVQKNEAINDAITDLCTDSKRFWRKGFVRVVGSGDWVYTGAKIGEDKVRQYNSKGELYGKILSPKSKKDGLAPVRLHDCRAEMGFSPEKLKAGTVTPAQLLMNVARFTDPACPVFARAYLFRQMVLVMDELDPMASGIAFSPSLKADVEAFKKLPKVADKQYGCWMQGHKLNTETPYIKFFESIASHDYMAEILASILPITDATATYAGFLDAQGNVIRVIPGEDALYVMKDGAMVPHTAEEKTPYLPLFVLSLPTPAAN